MIDALPRYMKTTYELKEVNNFIYRIGDRCEVNGFALQLQEFRDINIDTLGTAEQAMERAIELVKANIAWMYQSYESIDKWLTDFNGHY